MKNKLSWLVLSAVLLSANTSSAASHSFILQCLADKNKNHPYTLNLNKTKSTPAQILMPKPNKTDCFLVPNKTKTSFKVRYMGITIISGEILAKDAHATFASDWLTSLSATAIANSIYTDDRRRDELLRSKSFLDAKHYPTLHLNLSHNQNDQQLQGNLQIKNHKRPISLQITELSQEKEQIKLKLSGKIDRLDYGLGEQIPPNIIGRDINIFITTELSCPAKARGI